MSKNKKTKKTSDALEMMSGLVGDDPKRRLDIEQEILNSAISRIVYVARKKAGITQEELAHMVGTTQSAISRLEDADSDVNTTLPTLLRILHALNTRAQLDLNPTGKALSLA